MMGTESCNACGDDVSDVTNERAYLCADCWEPMQTLSLVTRALIVLERTSETARKSLRQMTFECSVGDTVYAAEQDGYVSSYQVIEVCGSEGRKWSQDYVLKGEQRPVTPLGEKVHEAWYVDKQTANQLKPARDAVSAALTRIGDAVRRNRMVL